MRVRSADGREVSLRPPTNTLGEGSFSLALPVAEDGARRFAAKLTGADLPGAHELDDFGRRAFEEIAESAGIELRRIHGEYTIGRSDTIPTTKEHGQPKIFEGGRLTFMDQTPPSFRDAPKIVRLRDGSSYRVRMPDGDMAPVRRSPSTALCAPRTTAAMP